MNTGDRCERCERFTIKVLDSKRVGSSTVRYYGCRVCGYRPQKNKVVVRRNAERLEAIKHR